MSCSFILGVCCRLENSKRERESIEREEPNQPRENQKEPIKKRIKEQREPKEDRTNQERRKEQMKREANARKQEVSANGLPPQEKQSICSGSFHNKPNPLVDPCSLPKERKNPQKTTPMKQDLHPKGNERLLMRISWTLC